MTTAGGLDSDPLNDSCDGCGAAPAEECRPDCSSWDTRTRVGLTLEQLQAQAFGAGLPYRDRSWHGMTLRDLCHQSHLCHPDWDLATIQTYAVVEEPFDPAVVHAAPIAEWLEGWRS